MQVLNNFDTETNFWEANPQLKIPFKDFLDQEDSSLMMWAIALIYHPDSKFNNLPLEERIQLINTDYLKKPLDLQEMDEVITKFKNLCLTRGERMLVGWDKKFQEREAFIDKVPYSAETYDMLDKMLTNKVRMWKDLNQIKEQIEKEKESSATAMGGAITSLSDENKI